MLSIKVDGNGPRALAGNREKKALHQKHQMFVELIPANCDRRQVPKPTGQRCARHVDGQIGSSYNTTEHDSMDVARSFNFTERKDTLTMQGDVELSFSEKNLMKISVDDIENMEGNTLLSTYHIEGFWKRLLVRQQVRMLKKGDNFGIYLIGNILWMMLVMMPMLAVVLKLLYVRRRFFYYEHVIFSFHAHSFMFLFITLLMLVSNWLGDAFGPVVGLSITAAAFYPMLAMKRFYGQRWPITIFKFLIVSFLYLVIFIIHSLAWRW
ncbi:MAG: hypothetical protein IPM82_26025 [Saprospiraceae bacterium]|nr:hypothetical protein [Saprospiraceae bacterium]